MTLVAVRQIYLDTKLGHESNEKPALCVRGRKYTHAVVIDYPVRALRRPVKDFDTLRPTVYHGEAYPVERMVKHLRAAGRRNGITKGAARLLTLAETDEEKELDEDDDLLTNEENEMVMTETNDAAPIEVVAEATEETVVTPKKVRAGKAKGQAKKAAPATSKAAKLTKKATPVAVKPKTGKKAVAKTNGGKAEGDGGPRAGTVGRYVYDRALAGDDNGKISEAAIKKFDNKKINVGYVAWWRNKFNKNGLLPVPLDIKKK
jgi:hypothetical protein